MPVEYTAVEWRPLETSKERQVIYSNINKLLNQGWKLEGNIVQMYYKNKEDIFYAQALTRITTGPTGSNPVNPIDTDPTNLEGGRVKRFTRKRR